MSPLRPQASQKEDRDVLFVSSSFYAACTVGGILNCNPIPLDPSHSPCFSFDLMIFPTFLTRLDLYICMCGFYDIDLVSW